MGGGFVYEMHATALDKEWTLYSDCYLTRNIPHTQVERKDAYAVLCEPAWRFHKKRSMYKRNSLENRAMMDDNSIRTEQQGGAAQNQRSGEFDELRARINQLNARKPTEEEAGRAR